MSIVTLLVPEERCDSSLLSVHTQIFTDARCNLKCNVAKRQDGGQGDDKSADIMASAP